MKTRSQILTMALIVLVLLMPAAAAAQSATPGASHTATPMAGPGVEASVTWLVDQQQEDGSWLGFSGEPDAGTTVDAIIALAAAAEADIESGDAIARGMGWLNTDGVASGYAENGVGAAAKLVMVLVATGAETLEIDGIYPLERVFDGQQAETGLYGTGLYDHAYALMALAASDSEVPATAISFLDTVQAENGGFAWDGATDEAMVDSNTTSMIVQALVAVGEDESETVASGISFLKLTVNEQGAAYSIGAEADANSTALVAQALLAVDQDATHLITSLATFQNANGAYHWMHSDVADNAFSTVQVIPAAVGVTLPIIPGMLDLEEAA